MSKWSFRAVIAIVLGLVAIDAAKIYFEGIDITRHVPFLIPGVVLAVALMWRWVSRHVEVTSEPGSLESIERAVEPFHRRMREDALLTRAADHPHYKPNTNRGDEGGIG